LLSAADTQAPLGTYLMFALLPLSGQTLGKCNCC
jgi:hypothetical protein